jgi:hypothetical protein
VVDEENSRRYTLSLELEGRNDDDDEMMNFAEMEGNFEGHENGCECVKCCIVKAFLQSQHNEDAINEDME